MGAGGDLRERLEAALGHGDGTEIETQPSRAADPMIARIGARARRRRRRSPSPVQYMTTLVDALARDAELAPDLLAIFEEIGITKSTWNASAAPDAREVPAPPTSPYRGAEEPRADRLVRLWNDDTTTQALVVELLTGTFGRSPSEARYLMLRTHHLGSAAFGDFTSHDADRLVATATTRAREHGFPLAITIEPVLAQEKPGFFGALLGR
jgi:ATP-dependent Clp protease adapter protein ClpS